MSQADLDVLEREVAAARGRLASDVAQLRNPSVLSDFGNDVAAKASSFKDQLIDRASDTAAGAAQRIWSDLKDRAAANPGAALAIGAGLAWHFARHPPITTLLVGLGLTSLMRTNPSSEPSPIVTRTIDLAGTANEKVREWSEEARDLVGAAGEKAHKWGVDAADTAGAALAQVASRAADITEDLATGSDRRDHYMLGIAALAIGAATVIAVQRNGDD